MKIDLEQVFLATELTEHVFSRCHGLRVYFAFGNLVQLPKVNAHPVRTIFLLNHDDGRRVRRR